MTRAALLCFASLFACSAPRQQTPSPRQPQSPPDDSPSPGTYQLMDNAHAPLARAGHSAVWTGGQMLVFGGKAGGALLSDGGAFFPGGGGWLAAKGSPDTPAARVGHTAVWTSSGMIVWGGEVADLLGGATLATATGGVYDPVADDWRKTSSVNAPSARTGHTAVSTGGQMLIWGGTAADGHLSTGATYDPVTDDWTPLPTVGAPTPRFGHTAVWTGHAMLVWGGAGATLEASGAAFDPALGRWTPLATLGAPSARTSHTAVWAGGRMLVFGGVGPTTFAGVGAVYDPATDTWAPMAEGEAPAGRVGHTAVAVGDNGMIVYGGHAGDSLFGDGGYYRLKAAAWQALPDRQYEPRTAHSAVWTGGAMAVWGGTTQLGVALASGIMYELPAPKTGR